MNFEGSSGPQSGFEVCAIPLVYALAWHMSMIRTSTSNSLANRWINISPIHLRRCSDSPKPRRQSKQ